MIASLTATTAGSDGLDHVVAELGLPLHVHRAVGDRQLGRLRDDRPPQPLRHGGPEHRAVGVARLLPEQHEIGALALEHLGEHLLVATRSDPASASSLTSTARSAPIASALRSESAAFSGPIDTTTTSVSESPFRRSASSTAFASK